MIKVYGDIMLDSWIIGKASRISPEAPVPVLKEIERKNSIGGAANLALNLSNIINNVSLFGAVGMDDEGFDVLKILETTNNIDCSIQSDSEITTTKTRLVGQHGQHIMRWDREKKYKGKAQARFLESANEEDIVCLSDYNKGTIGAHLVEKLNNKKCKVLVDPKQGPEVYKGAFLVKPNMKEYRAWFGKFKKEVALVKLKEYGWKYLVVTDGANGIHVLSDELYYQHYKEPAREVADVTGAGDTVLAVIAYGIERGMDVFAACKLACYAGARSVEHRGVYAIQTEDLKRQVVWTNGVFDILHEGHFRLLRHARSKGRKLIVGINSDASTKRLKGEDRPINNQLQRKMNLELLPWIDEVVIFDEDTPINCIERFQPDLIIKGGDYTIETVVGHELAEVEIFPTVKDQSTTRIIEKMKI
tara:strand:+ start:193 stop:1443 length:1251 start_codon:yes stop_codon:yes gene_type:complete